MKKITRGPIIELFESEFGPNRITEFLWNQPIGNYFSDQEIAKEFNGGKTLPNGLVNREDVRNTALDTKTIEEYKYYYKESYKRYHSIFKDSVFRQFIGRLHRAEIQMIQARCLLEINPKFTILKQKDKDGNQIQYIVARTPFYRESTKRDEITYYVGKTEEWGEDLDKLKDDPIFREAAIKGLTKLMLENMV
jgi:hypothetical protein